MLAIAAKFGYESRNQECTFALVSSLVEDKKIDFEQALLDKIALFNVDENIEQTSIEIREKFQYGTSLSIEDTVYSDLFSLAQDVLLKIKQIIEQNLDIK